MYLSIQTSSSSYLHVFIIFTLTGSFPFRYLFARLQWRLEPVYLLGYLLLLSLLLQVLLLELETLCLQFLDFSLDNLRLLLFKHLLLLAHWHYYLLFGFLNIVEHFRVLSSCFRRGDVVLSGNLLLLVEVMLIVLARIVLDSSHFYILM